MQIKIKYNPSKWLIVLPNSNSLFDFVYIGYQLYLSYAVVGETSCTVICEIINYYQYFTCHIIWSLFVKLVTK